MKNPLLKANKTSAKLVLANAFPHFLGKEELISNVDLEMMFYYFVKSEADTD